MQTWLVTGGAGFIGGNFVLDAVASGIRVVTLDLLTYAGNRDTLSPLDGIGPDDLNIKGLIDRVAKGGIREIIIAVNATVEGQTTAHYITDHLTGLDVKITRLAHGVPVGGELDYLDEGTLSAAIRARTTI